ncbi:IS66 family transposase, partial [Stenotrophomonas maltophilia]
CTHCQSMTQASMPAYIIDKGIAAVGLLAQVLIAKYADHLPLYRQEAIFKRDGMHIPRSSMAQWVGQCGHELQPLVDALRRCILQHR